MVLMTYRFSMPSVRAMPRAAGGNADQVHTWIQVSMPSVRAMPRAARRPPQ